VTLTSTFLLKNQRILTKNRQTTCFFCVLTIEMLKFNTLK